MNKNWNCIKNGAKLLVIGAMVSALIAGCGGGATNPSGKLAGTLKGVAAVGSPINNGMVSIICAAGGAGITWTTFTGDWEISFTGQTLPCAVQVSGGTINGAANATSYHSIATTPGTVNVTPLTDLMVANLAGTATPDVWFAGLTTTPTSLTTITQANVDASLTKLRAALSGLTPLSTINPITTAFTAAPGNVSDDMLAALQTAITKSTYVTGGTIVTYTTLLSNASAPAFTAPVASFNTTLATAYTGTASGSTPAPTGSTNYVTWSNSANGTTIKDTANNNFAVDASTRAVIALASNTNLTGLTVDSAANVLNNGTQIGSVTTATSTTGGTIAAFTCSNGSGMTITVTTGWSYSCGTGGGTTPGGGGTPSGDTGSNVSFNVNETSEINATLTGQSPNYVATSTLTLTAPTRVWTFSWAQYSASFYAVDATNAQLVKNGSAFSGYRFSPAGQSGFSYINLPAGTWYVGVIPDQTVFSSYSNPVYAEMSAVSMTGYTETANYPLGTSVINPGGWQMVPFTIPTGSRAFVETEGHGGIFTVMTTAQANSFSSTYANGAVNGSYSYTYACGTTSGGPTLEIECELKLPPGNYALVYINDSSSPSGGAGNVAVFQ